MELTRRGVLSAGVAAALAVAGCTTRGSPGNIDNNTSNPDNRDADSVPELTGHVVSDHTVTPTGERFSDMDSWGLFLASREAAYEYFGDVDERGAAQVRTFIDETGFDAGDRLLYLHAYAPQTCYKLVLDDEPQIAQNGLPRIDARVDRTAPDDQPCGDAVTSVRLLVRLLFNPEAGSTDVVEVHISGHRDESEELLIEAER